MKNCPLQTKNHMSQRCIVLWIACCVYSFHLKTSLFFGPISTLRYPAPLNHHLAKIFKTIWQRRFRMSATLGVVAAVASAFTSLYLSTAGGYYAPDACQRVEKALKDRVMGQELATEQLVDAVCRHLRQKDNSKPLVISLHGPPGVGKTLTHRCVVLSGARWKKACGRLHGSGCVCNRCGDLNCIWGLFHSFLGTNRNPWAIKFTLWLKDWWDHPDGAMLLSVVCRCFDLGPRHREGRGSAWACWVADPQPDRTQ